MKQFMLVCFSINKKVYKTEVANSIKMNGEFNQNVNKLFFWYKMEVETFLLYIKRGYGGIGRRCGLEKDEP